MYFFQKKSFSPLGVASELASRVQFTFGHEVGHILGLQHNGEDLKKDEYNPDGVGYLLPATNKRTIMGYIVLKSAL